MAKRPENGKVGGDIGIELKHQLDEHLEKHGGNRSEFITKRIDEYLNAAASEASSGEVEELVATVVELTEAIEGLRVSVNHLKESQTASIRRDISEFMKVILLNHRTLFGTTELTERQVKTLLSEMFSWS